MSQFQKLHMLPLGSIQAEGFLKDQLVIGKDGMAGHLYELEPEMIAEPYVKDTHVGVWSAVEQAGWQAEISGNYWTGYIQHAYTLGDEEMIARATQWVDDMLKQQRADGYLGTYRREGADMLDDFNASGNTCAYRGLIAFYEATGRQDVLDALHRAMLWFCENWAGDNKTCYSGQAIVEPMVQVYHLTGDQRLADFARDYMEYVPKHDVFKNSYKAMLEGELKYFSTHAAGLAHGVRYPALVYTATGDERYLQASVRRIDQALKKNTHLSGGSSCVAEYIAPVASTTEHEYCSFTFYTQSYNCMAYITGDPKYGDLMENVFYNAAQGARKKDERAIAYLTAPNQIYATLWSSSSGDDVQVYAPCYHVACCPVNAVLIVPEFIRSMIHRDDADNLYVMAYGPCSLNYKDIAITEKTLYPFRNKVEFTINCDKKFVLNLKIPGWAKGYAVTVNGEEIRLENVGGFVTLDREWKHGDRVEISFKAEIEIIKVDDSDYAKKYPLAIRYGTLLFSYHIPEDWREVKARSMTPLPEGWHWYGAFPAFKEADVPDFHERLGLRRQQFSWNVVLDENLSVDDIEIEELPENGYVWENPLIKLHTHCYKAPLMNAPYQVITHEPFGDYQEVTERLPLTLEPYGCTNLRITYFHKADLSIK